jgi:predicted Zn-dependent peptidase
VIEFDRFVLANGLRVLYHYDASTPMVAMNVLYDVGSRDEDPEHTGFAHLFEHLMFGGSVNIPRYDEPLERAGGENNAFTSTDITSYYLTVPAGNVEIGFWLESDRMLGLAFSEKSLEVQRNVVMEEFKQRYLNNPYGDVWLLLRPLAYKKHPYRWATIGRMLEHIEHATMEQVKAFFNAHYHPANAILAIGGNISLEQVKVLVDKWFGSIPSKPVLQRQLAIEPIQTACRTLTVERDVPYDAIYMVWHMCQRLHPDYYVFDLLSDYLSGGNSSRFYVNLVQKKQLFSEIQAYISGEHDNGLFVVSGKLASSTTMEVAELAINEEIELVKTILVDETEMVKLKNKAESLFLFSEMNVLNKTMLLAQMELLGDAGMINLELAKYQSVTALDVQRVAKQSLIASNLSVLYYHTKGKILPSLQPLG